MNRTNHGQPAIYTRGAVCVCVDGGRSGRGGGAVSGESHEGVASPRLGPGRCPGRHRYRTIIINTLGEYCSSIGDATKFKITYLRGIVHV